MKELQLKNAIELTEEESMETEGGVLPLAAHAMIQLVQLGFAAATAEYLYGNKK
jgi:hypothetical protein